MRGIALQHKQSAHLRVTISSLQRANSTRHLSLRSSFASFVRRFFTFRVAPIKLRGRCGNLNLLVKGFRRWLKLALTVLWQRKGWQNACLDDGSVNAKLSLAGSSADSVCIGGRVA